MTKTLFTEVYISFENHFELICMKQEYKGETLNFVC